MGVQPKAPPVYRPDSQRVVAPPVYKPGVSMQAKAASPVYHAQQVRKPPLQPKLTGGFRLETRPAPPAFKLAAPANAVSAQRTRVPSALPISRYKLPDVQPSAPAPAFPSALKKIVQPHKQNSLGAAIQSKSKAYDLPEDQRPIELGGTFSGRLFLFRGGRGRTRLIVSAHGMVKPETTPKTIPVPGGMTLHFYSVHGELLVDPGLVLPADDHITRGSGVKVANYVLSKYQGTHSGANETYEAIVDAVAGNAFDVLTVRHRFYGKEITLQDVLTAIAGRGYSDIYLNACRYVAAPSQEDLEMRAKDFQSLGYERLT
jgi:hypothetical protein